MNLSAQRLPNFFVAGVPKAGTTSLYFQLRQHPQVYMSRIKEPTFFAARDLLGDPQRSQFLRWLERDPAMRQAFVRDTEQSPATHWVLRWDEYVELFRGARDAHAIGEATVDYFWLPSAAQAIRSKLPEARLIFVLRHPVERLFSWYLLALWREPKLTFREWFDTARHAGAVWWPAVDAGRYATHLGRFLEVFPREQVRTYLYDDYRTDARAVLRDIFTFLGVDAAHTIDVSRRHNETVVPRFRALDRLRRRVLKGRSISRHFPTRVGHLLRGLYYRRPDDFAMGLDDRRMVIGYYRDELTRTSAIIDRDLAAWLQ